MTVHLTKRIIDALAPREIDYVEWDGALPGFGVRVRRTGSKSYVVIYRAGSGRKAPQRRVTLGAAGKLTVEEARRKARQIVGRVASGADPAAEKTAYRETLTLSDLIDIFLSDHVKAKRKPGTARHYADILNRIVRPALGRSKLLDVTSSAVARLHLDHAETPYQANRILAILGSMFSFAAKRELVPHGFSPARGIEKFRESGRERFLSTDELERLGAALRIAETDGIPWDIDPQRATSKHVPKANRTTVISPYATAAIRLLLFTGCRLREILHLRWSEVDFDRGLLMLPDSKTGKKSVVLGAPALAILASLPSTGTFVIAGEAPDAPRSDLKRPWGAIRRAAGLGDFRIHDLRHSFASFGAAGGYGLPVVGKLLGHKHATTTARYTHLDVDPLRRAADSIGVTISAGLDRTAGANVIPIKKS